MSIDLEVATQTGRIHAFAGERPDSGRSVVFPEQGRTFDQALADLDDLADGASFLLGHNLIKFDLPHLQAASPGMRLLQLPATATVATNTSPRSTDNATCSFRPGAPLGQFGHHHLLASDPT